MLRVVLLETPQNDADFDLDVRCSTASPPTARRRTSTVRRISAARARRLDRHVEVRHVGMARQCTRRTRYFPARGSA